MGSLREVGTSRSHGAWNTRKGWAEMNRKAMMSAMGLAAGVTLALVLMLASGGSTGEYHVASYPGLLRLPYHPLQHAARLGGGPVGHGTGSGRKLVGTRRAEYLPSRRPPTRCVSSAMTVGCRARRRRTQRQRFAFSGPPGRSRQQGDWGSPIRNLEGPHFDSTAVPPGYNRRRPGSPPPVYGQQRPRVR
jgi:hypothetical protein